MNSWGGTQARLVLGVLGAAALALLPAASSSADTFLGESGGYFYVKDTVTNSGDFNITADCPGNSHIGGGGVNGTFSRVEPADGPDADRRPDDKWKVRVYTSGATPLDAYAICTPDRPKYVRRSKSIDPAQERIVKVICPRGTKVIGGGGSITAAGAAAGELYLNSSFPYDNGDANLVREDGWAVRTVNISAVPGTLRASAVCLDTGPFYAEIPGVLPPNGGTSGLAECPVTHHVVGIGAQSLGPATDGLTGALEPYDASGGMDDVDTVPDDAGEAFITNASGSNEAYTVVAICLN